MTSASVQYVANIGVVKRIDVVRSHRRGHNFSMTMIRLSGSQLHAARVLVGLSLDELADRAKLCRHSIRKWETSSDAVPGAMYPNLCRVVDILEAEGVIFTDVGVHLARPGGVTLHSLRHTHASMWIAAGVDLLTVSRRLGHASLSVTLDVYGHLVHGADDRAAQIMEAAFG